MACSSTAGVVAEEEEAADAAAAASAAALASSSSSTSAHDFFSGDAALSAIAPHGWQIETRESNRGEKEKQRKQRASRFAIFAPTLSPVDFAKVLQQFSLAFKRTASVFVCALLEIYAAGSGKSAFSLGHGLFGGRLV